MGAAARDHIRGCSWKRRIALSRCSVHPIEIGGFAGELFEPLEGETGMDKDMKVGVIQPATDKRTGLDGPVFEPNYLVQWQAKVCRECLQNRRC